MSGAVIITGTWKGRQVAVKVISHSAEDDERISRELSLRCVQALRAAAEVLCVAMTA